MGISLIQQKVTTNANGDTGAISFNSALTAGNSAIALISYWMDGDPVAGCSIGSENLSLVTFITNATNGLYIMYIHNITGGETTFRVTLSDLARVSVNFSEWSGLLNSAPESTNTNSGTASSTVTTNSATPSSTDNLIIGAGGWGVNDYSTGPTNGFTRMTQAGGGVSSGAWLEGGYLIQSAASAASTGWGLTAGINWLGAIAAFGGTASASARFLPQRKFTQAVTRSSSY